MKKKVKKKIALLKASLMGIIGGAFVTDNLPDMNIKRELIRDWNTLFLPYAKDFAYSVIFFTIGSILVYLYQLFVKYIWPTLLILLVLLQARFMASSSSQRTREQAYVLIMLALCFVVCTVLIKQMEREEKNNPPTA